MSALSCSIAAGGIWNGDAEQTAGALLRFTFSLKKRSGLSFDYIKGAFSSQKFLGKITTNRRLGGLNMI